MKQEKKYVINLHLLENCNYCCKHCFARFNSGRPLTVRDWKRIIDNITAETPVSRFNLAGGEPLLYQGLDEIIDYINSNSILVSLITNGHLLSEERIRSLKGKIYMIGLSIDAIRPDMLLKIGRCTNKGEILTPVRSMSLCNTIKENNMQLKINTVVSKLNFQENFTDFIETVCPDRWKILKMKRFSNGMFDNSEIEISENEFNQFCSMYSSIPHIKEINLKNSYVFIDSGGRLVDNSGEYDKPISNLLLEDFSSAFRSLTFDESLYESRYNSTGNNAGEKCP